MALFENYEGRMPQLQPVLDKYGFKNFDEVKAYTNAKGVDAYSIVETWLRNVLTAMFPSSRTAYLRLTRQTTIFYRESQECTSSRSARSNGIIVDETPFTMAELMDADEIIVSSSTKFCSPACEMNGTPIGGKAPELVDLIQKKYDGKFENETM